MLSDHTLHGSAFSLQAPPFSDCLFRGTPIGCSLLPPTTPETAMPMFVVGAAGLFLQCHFFYLHGYLNLCLPCLLPSIQQPHVCTGVCVRWCSICACQGDRMTQMRVAAVGTSRSMWARGGGGSRKLWKKNLIYNSASFCKVWVTSFLRKRPQTSFILYIRLLFPQNFAGAQKYSVLSMNKNLGT